MVKLVMNKDVIIVLGGGIGPGGALPETSKLRVAKGVELFKDEEVASRIIMSGKWGFWLDVKPPRTEAEAMKECAVNLGVTDNVIFKEEVSMDTIGNAYFCKVNFLEPNKWRRIVVVTSDYHISRTRYIFEKVLGDDYSIDFVGVGSRMSSNEFDSRVDKEERTLELLKTWLDPIDSGDTKAIKEMMFTKHPAYAEKPEITKEQLLKLLG